MLPTTALLHQPRIARVHYRLITKLQFRGVYGTTNNRFVVGMTVYGTTNNRFVVGMTTGRGTRSRIGTWHTTRTSSCGRLGTGSRSMRVPHTTSTPSTSTCGGFTGLRGQISSPCTLRRRLTRTTRKMWSKMCMTLPLGTTHNYREPCFKDTW